jgi:hypothetical protein
MDESFLIESGVSRFLSSTAFPLPSASLRENHQMIHRFDTARPLMGVNPDIQRD